MFGQERCHLLRRNGTRLALFGDFEEQEPAPPLKRLQRARGKQQPLLAAGPFKRGVVAKGASRTTRRCTIAVRAVLAGFTAIGIATSVMTSGRKSRWAEVTTLASPSERVSS